jgi:hypothetical protein
VTGLLVDEADFQDDPATVGPLGRGDPGGATAFERRTKAELPARRELGHDPGNGREPRLAGRAARVADHLDNVVGDHEAGHRTRL